MKTSFITMLQLSTLLTIPHMVYVAPKRKTQASASTTQEQNHQNQEQNVVPASAHVDQIPATKSNGLEQRQQTPPRSDSPIITTVATTIAHNTEPHKESPKSPRLQSPKLTATDLVSTPTSPVTKLTPSNIPDDVRRQLEALELNGWDLAGNDDAPGNAKPKPDETSWLTQLYNAPTDWWTRVTGNNRLEKGMRLLGYPTSEILLNKIDQKEYVAFIASLNLENEEGARWIDAAFLELLKTKNQYPTRKLLRHSTEYLPRLPVQTKQAIAGYLRKVSDDNREAFQEELAEFAQDQTDIQQGIAHLLAESFRAPSPTRYNQTVKTTALALTSFASKNQLPFEQK